MPTGREYRGPLPAASTEQVTRANLPTLVVPGVTVPAGTPGNTLIVRPGGSPQRTPSFIPPLGFSAATPGLLGHANTAFTSGTVNRQYMHPYDVRGNWACAGPTISVTTAVSGGTTPQILIGLYASDANGYPDTTQLLRTATVTDLTTGNKAPTWSQGEIVLADGQQYWIGTIYTHAAAPTTYPAVSCITNCTWTLPVSTGPSVNVGRGLYVAGSALKTTATANNAWTVTGNADVPSIWLRRSATN